MRAEYDRQKAASAGVTGFDRWFAGGANNAGIAAAGLYADRVPQFAALLAAEDGDLVRFYARVRALAAMPAAEREAALAATRRAFLATASGSVAPARSGASGRAQRVSACFAEKNQLYLHVPLPHPEQTGGGRPAALTTRARPIMTRRSALHASL